jgi:hypothetical protein
VHYITSALGHVDCGRKTSSSVRSWTRLPSLMHSAFLSLSGTRLSDEGSVYHHTCLVNPARLQEKVLAFQVVRNAIASPHLCGLSRNSAISRLCLISCRIQEKDNKFRTVRNANTSLVVCSMSLFAQCTTKRSNLDRDTYHPSR